MAIACMRCSSGNVSVRDTIALDGRKLVPHVCNDCSYTWYIDIDPPAVKAVDLYVSREMALERENEALREIIENQARVIENYQDMINGLGER